MKTIHATIEGERPILFNNPAGMKTKKTGKERTYKPEEDAAASCYWTEDGHSLAMPAMNVRAAMVNEARFYKVGKKQATPYVAGAFEIEPAMIPFGTKEYEIDMRRAVVQHQGIIRARAMLRKWSLSFNVLIEDSAFPAILEMLPALLQDAGQRAGLGDFRLEKKGPFGKFKLAEWKEM